MKNIFVGNLDFGATESSVRALFEPYGAVERVNVVTDRDTGRSRGFAFVEMTDSAEADRAIAGLNGRDLGGRSLNVNEARPKTQGGGGGGGRRGFGGAPGSVASPAGSSVAARRKVIGPAAAPRFKLFPSRDRKGAELPGQSSRSMKEAEWNTGIWGSTRTKKRYCACTGLTG